MKDWIRIILVVFVLISGTAVFGFWSLQQFDNAFENLSASYIAIISPLVRELPATDMSSTSSPQAITPVTATSTSLGQATSTPTTPEVEVKAKAKTKTKASSSTSSD